MGRLPRYQRLGVRDRQFQGTDYAGFRGQARSAQAMSQAFDQMGQFLYKQAQEDSVQAGLERVRSEGAQPILERLREQGGPRGLEEKTAYEAANRIAVAEIRTEAELEITKILDQGQAKKLSYSAIQAQLKDVSDGFPAALSDIDPVSAGLLRTQLQEATSKAELRYSKWWTGEIAKQRKVKQNQVAANEAEFILGNATVPGYTTQAIDDDITKGAQTLLDLGVKQELVDEWSDGIREKAYKENFLFDFYQKPIDEQRDLMESVLEGEKTLPGMDYETSIRFVNGLLRPEYNRNLAAVKSQSDFVVNKASDAEDILVSGGRISQDLLADMRDKANDVAEFDGGAALNAVNELQETDTFFSQLRGASLSEVEAMVVDLQDGVDGTLDTAKELQRYEQASKYLSNMRTQLQQDPLGFAERVGFIERRSALVSLGEDGSIIVDDAALEERAAAALRVQNYYGLPEQKLLFADEARQIGLLLDRADGNAKLEVLGALSKFNKATGQVLTDIADYNPNMAMVGALVSQGATEAAQLAVAGMDRLKAGEKPVEFTDTNTVPVFQDTFDRAITAPIQAQAIKGVAKAIYAELAANQGVDNFDEQLYEQALQMAAGQRLVNGELYGGIQEVRGVPTFIHSKQNAGSYERILDNITPQLIETVVGQKLDSGLAMSINENENYKIRNISGDKYVIEYGPLGDAVVQDADGDPIIFKGQDLIDAMVPVPGAMAMPTQPTMPGAPEPAATGDFIGAEAAAAPDVPTEQMGTLEPGQTFKKRTRLAAQSIRSQLQDTSGEQVRKAFNQPKVRRIRADKDNQLNTLFQDDAFFAATRSEQKGYQKYLTDALRDDSITKMKTFGEWKASQ
jgi:hypothetical protein